MSSGSSHTGLFFDVDRPQSALELEELAGCEIPAPSFLVTRHDNGHSLAAWLLSAPVHRYPGARIRPLQVLTRTAEYIHQALGADAGYTGVLVRNAHVADDRFQVTWGREGGYLLKELADYIPHAWRRPRLAETAVGRNCDLFRGLMRWAGSHPDGDLAWRADVLNATFAIPLPASEVGDTVRSVERYRRQWSERGWHRPSWIARQSARGKRGGEASGHGSWRSSRNGLGAVGASGRPQDRPKEPPLTLEASKDGERPGSIYRIRARSAGNPQGFYFAPFRTR